MGAFRIHQFCNNHITRRATMYKVTFKATSADEFFSYQECVDFFGREEFKDILKGKDDTVSAYPINEEEAA